jgi:hypothetical protein
MKREDYEIQVDTRDELLARILEAASRTKKREDQLKQTNKQTNKQKTCDLCPRVAQ